MTNSVFAIIVTYNRKALLRECLDAVLNQSFKPASVIVINNASTDGTAEMLEADYGDRVTRLHMTHNLGGGGGFYKGMKFGHENGADWLWLMDDDGVPDPDSLAAMMDRANSQAFAVMNPMVVCIDDAKTLSFGLEIEGEVDKSVANVLQYAKTSQVWPGQINPFNGTLISREAIDKIGFPRPEMFIWGDEIDYCYRLEDSGLPYATILNSIHRHPAERGSRINLGPFGTVDTRIERRLGVCARNMGYLYRRNRGWKLRYIKPLVMALYYAGQARFRESFDFMRYYLDGYFDLYRLSPSRTTLRAQENDYRMCPIAKVEASAVTAV